MSNISHRTPHLKAGKKKQAISAVVLRVTHRQLGLTGANFGILKLFPAGLGLKYYIIFVSGCARNSLRFVVWVASVHRS